jgi:hemerythrin superfamily protein
LNSTTIDKLHTIVVKYRSTLIIWARRVIAKHNLLKSVQTKAIQMEHSIQEFKDLFEELFIKGLPQFWDVKGEFYYQGEYNSHVAQFRMDHTKFEILEENLKGTNLVEYLTTYFEILNQFKTINI